MIRLHRPRSVRDRHLGSLVFALQAIGCAGFPDKAPTTSVVLDNDYAPSASAARVVYQALWLNVSFPAPVAPGTSSDPQSAIPTSQNTAYVLLAPGWDPTSSTPPTAFVVMQSRDGFGVALGDTLHIPVDDSSFEGNCSAGSHLSQAQADFLTQIVFASDFAGLRYEASTCTTTQAGDASAP
jgi:hypothetical protein